MKSSKYKRVKYTRDRKRETEKDWQRKEKGKGDQE